MSDRSPSEWSEVTATDPCPICGKPDWCGRTRDGAVRCMREDEPPGGWFVAKGTDEEGGTVFRPAGNAAATRRGRTSSAAKPRLSVIQLSRIWARTLDHLTPERLQALADSVGLPVEAVDGFGVGILGYCPKWKAYAIAETNASDEIVGIQYRALRGKKKAAYGGSRGIVGVRNLRWSGVLYLCEGWSDAAALYSIGFEDVLGLPNAGGGSRFLRKILRWGSYSEVVIVADPKPREQKAARRLKDALSDLSAVTVVTPLDGRDLREWVIDGATRADIEALVSADRGWRAFPTEALPKAVSDVCVQGARALDVDPAMFAVPALAVLGGAVGATRQVQAKKGHVEPAVVWSLVVAKSGTGKSPALRPILAPLRQLQRIASRDYETKMPAHEREVETHKDDCRIWRRQRREAQKKGEDVPPRPSRPEEPKHERFVVSDVTVEALAVVLRDNPRGVLLDRDEASGWFGSFNRYARGSHGDEAYWIGMFDAGLVIVDRKTSPTIAVPRAAVSIVGGIQPSVFERAIRGANTENGIAARFLIARPPLTTMRYTDEEIPSCALARYSDLVSDLTGLAFNDGEPVTVPLSPAARRRYQNWINAPGGITDRIPKANEPVAAALAKVKTYAVRIALLFHCCEDPDGAEIPVERMERAIRLADWFDHEAVRLYADIAKSSAEDDTDELVAWIKGRRGFVTPRELHMNRRRYGKPKGAAQRRLETLAAEGYGKMVKEDGKNGFRLSEDA